MADAAPPPGKRATRLDADAAPNQTAAAKSDHDLLHWQAFADAPQPKLGYFMSVGGGLGQIEGPNGGGKQLHVDGTKMVLGCEPGEGDRYLKANLTCCENEYFIVYQSRGGVALAMEEARPKLAATLADEAGRIKGIYKRMPGKPAVTRTVDKDTKAEKCVIAFDVVKLTEQTGAVGFDSIDEFDIKCSGGNPPRRWEGPAEFAEEAPPNWGGADARLLALKRARGAARKALKDCPKDSADHAKLITASAAAESAFAVAKMAAAAAGVGPAGGARGVAFRGSVGSIPRTNWRYHQICNFMRNRGLGPWAADVEQVAAADADPPLAFALSLEAFVEADTNKDGRLDRAAFLELAAAGLCPSAAAALAGRFGAADANSSGDLDPAEFHAALVDAGVPAAEVQEWLDLRRSGDRVLVPHGEGGRQPGRGLPKCHVGSMPLRMAT